MFQILELLLQMNKINNMEFSMKNKKCEICLDEPQFHQTTYIDRNGDLTLPVVCGNCIELDDDEKSQIVEDGVSPEAVWKGGK
tara:strand:- start:1763 stop:2011 length:249 start_codon:yes stop_codon:yes gene_type:complete